MMTDFYQDPRLPAPKSLEGVRTWEEMKQHLQTTVVYEDNNLIHGIKPMGKPSLEKPRFKPVQIKFAQDKPVVDQFPQLAFFTTLGWSVFCGKDASRIQLLTDFCQQINEDVEFFTFSPPKNVVFTGYKVAPFLAIDRKYLDQFTEFLLSLIFRVNETAGTNLSIGLQKLSMDDPWTFGELLEAELKQLPVIGIYACFKESFEIVYVKDLVAPGKYQTWSLQPIESGKPHPSKLVFDYSVYSAVLDPAHAASTIEVPLLPKTH